METSRSKAIGGGIVALAALLFAWSAPANSQVQTQTASAQVDAQVPSIANAPQAASQPAAAASPAAAVASIAPVQPTMKQKVKAALAKISPERVLRDREYKKAASTFTSFCEDWGRKLKDREKYNLSRLVWTHKGDYESTTYTGYTDIESCTTKESDQGFALGKLSYKEVTYYLVGKTETDALHATPQDTGEVHTTEIFRWDKGKWFY